MRKIDTVAEQLTLDGPPDYVVYYDDGSVYLFKQKPTDDDLYSPARQGRQLRP